MSSEREDDPSEAQAARDAEPRDRDEDEEEDASSPFDHPAFLPVIVTAVALWFGFDGWFDPDTESIRFNRYGFGFLAGAALYFTLDEFARFPYLTPLLFLGYAIWLGALATFGSPDAWYSDEPMARLFNRYAGIGFLALAALAALRETWRRRKRAASAPPS